MKLTHQERRERGGFTLIELLVIITIIAILLSLLIVAISRALSTGKQAQAQADIRQLDPSIENFKAKMNVPYIPSRIRVCERFSYYATPTPAILGGPLLDQDSIEYLQRLFPRIDVAGWTNIGIDWNGDGVINPANGGGDVILEGDQCLVFFLGGIPLNAAGVPLSCQGFSTNPANPAAATTDRMGPFYEGFTAGRLARILTASSNPRRSPFFFSLLDSYSQGDGFGNIVGQGAPYAYFSSYKTPGGYLRYGSTDCPTLGLTAYARNGKPLNFSTHQIICAGSNSQFAPGGNWTPGVGAWLNNTAAAGFDDLSNFSDRQLSVP
jgi:prepilin-type N-terminal cleavage/methylation domain-containing protein